MFREFPPSAERVASDWRERILSNEDWTAVGTPGEAGGQATGYYATNGPLRAFAKPSTLDADAIPRAAHEKIASDLAFDLGLPLPPAVLHTWRPAPPVGTQPNVVLSLIPFWPAHKWDHAKTAAPDQEPAMKAELRLAASALVAFDTWVHNTDRVNGGNLLVCRGTKDGAPVLRAAYIDYSYTMLYSWKPEFTQIQQVGPFPIDGNQLAADALREAVRRIEVLPVERVHATVNRIPEDFLAADRRPLVIEGLLHRKANLRASLQPLLGALPQ